jgi:hypothetical protein
MQLCFKKHIFVSPQRVAFCTIQVILINFAAPNGNGNTFFCENSMFKRKKEMSIAIGRPTDSYQTFAIMLTHLCFHCTIPLWQQSVTKIKKRAKFRETIPF